MKETMITPSCRFECEMVLGPDVRLEEEEIYKIHDESIAMFIQGKFQWVSISDFKNVAGQSIGEYLLDKHLDFALALVKKAEEL